jgi:hypothetical protein
MTNAETAHANAPDAVPRLPDVDASGGGDDAASAAKTGGSRAARRGSASPFSMEELASLDAVRDEAKRRYTRALAPMLGEKTYGHSEREAEADAEAEAEREAAREAAKATTGRSNDERSSRLDAELDATGVPNDEALPYEPTLNEPTADDATHPKRMMEATAKVGVAALMAEVKARAREYVARREAELARAARARAEAAERVARERRAERAEEQKKQARGLGKVQFETDAEVDFAAEAKREAVARQAAERQLNNELLEARLRAWPMSRVLSAVEEAIRATLAERRRAAGLDQEDELFGAGSVPVGPRSVVDPAMETDGDGTNGPGPLNEPAGLASGETRALSGDARSATERGVPSSKKKPGPPGPGLKKKKPRKGNEETTSSREERRSERVVGGDLFSSSFARKLSSETSRKDGLVVLSPEDAATSRAYDAACVAFRVAPNEKTRDGLLSESGVCDVSGACLGDDAARAAARGVGSAPKVTHLRMRACDIGPDGFRGIFAELPGSECVCVGETLRKSSPTLTALDFSMNPRGLGTVGSRALCEWLSGGFGKNVNANGTNALAVLDLRGCDVRDSEGAAVIAALGANASSLTRLNLAENALGAKSAAALARFLETSPRCADVDVSANGFGPSDGETIAQALMRSPRSSVTHLSLARNGLEDSGCVAFAHALARNASLVELDLRRVRFGPAAARATAAAFAKNTTLESIRLDGNDIGADGCASLLRALDASRLARRLDERDVSTEPGSSLKSSLKSVSLVGARTQDAAFAARALGERRFLAEGGGKKPKKGKKGGAKGKKGGAKKGGKKGKAGELAVPVLQSELAQAAPGTFRAFETSRPEGRHVFDLVDPAQRGVAGAMFEADHGPRGGSAEDTSVRSSNQPRQNIMNLTLDGVAVKEDPVAMGWPDALPNRGVLRFDFAALGVDGLAAPNTRAVLDDAAFANTSRDVGSRRLTPRERLEALEHARRDRAFTCAQAAALLETFDVGESRVNAAAALLPRLAPLPPRDAGGVATDESVLTDESALSFSLAAEAQAVALAPLTAFEQTAVFARFGVGHARYLPFRRGAPSGRYELDMALRCDRAVAASLAAEAAKDADFENFRRVEVEADAAVSGDDSHASDVAAWTRDSSGAPPPTSGVLKFEYVKKPESFTDAAGAWTDGARRLRGVEAKAIAARLRRRDAGPKSFGYVAGSEADAVVAFRRAMCGDSTRVDGASANQRTMTCAFAGAIVAAARDSETRVELAVASRDFCVDVGENWLQVVESLRGDEQAAACARVEAWPEADVAAGVAAFERSERKAERTARRREARLEREREAAEAKAAAEAEKAAEKAAREAAKAAEKAAREAAKGGKKKKEATATNAEESEDAADADDGDAEATAVHDPDEEREDGIEGGDGEGDDEAAADEAASETESAADAAEEATIADAAEEESADGCSETPADAPKKSKKTLSKEASSSSAADDEMDEEDGQPLEIGEPVMAPASMRYVLDCANATHAAVFEKIIAAAAAAPSKWRSIRNFRVGGAARDDLVENRGETLQTLFARAEAAAKEAAVVRDASAVDDVTRAACAAKRRESDIAFYERKRAEAAKARVEAKSSRKSRAATRDDDDDDDFGFPTLDPPSRAHEEKLSGAPFIVQLDFFGLDIFERFRVPFMEKRFYREAFLDVRTKALEADGVRHAHAFHLREMAAEACDDAERAEKARAEAEARAVRVERDKEEAEEAEEANDANDADADDADDAEDREDVRDGEDKDVVKDVGDDSAKLDSAKRATETEALITDETEVNLSKPFETSAIGNARAAAEENDADSVPPEVAFPTVLVAGPAFAPASSAWFAPPTWTSSGEIFARENKNTSHTFARASLADPSPVYRKTWERFGAARARLERDASYYSAARVVHLSTQSEETVSEGGAEARVQTPTRMRRFHACPLREIWQDVRHETWRLNVSELESVSAKLRKIVDAAAPAAALARAAEEAMENANADPRLVEAREADPIDQNLVKTLETELAETLVPLRLNLETAREKAERAAEAAAAAETELARKDNELRLLRLRGAFGGDDATAPARRANDVLKKRTGGVGFSETLIEQCCALTDACVENLRVYEAELKAFNENPPAPPEPPKPGDDAGGSAGSPPPPQPPKRPADVRSITWRAFETMFMSTDFAELQRGAAENDTKGNKAKANKNENTNAPRREDAIAAAVRLERAEARAKAAARAEAAAARARAAAEAAAAAREAAGEEPIDPMDAVSDPRESASADPAASLASEDEDGDAEGAADAAGPPRPPLAVVGLPRITPATLAAFAASRAAAEKAALAAAAAAEAKAAKGTKGKKPPAKKKPGKAADAGDSEDAPEMASPPSARFAAGLFSGDDLVKAAAGVDPNPFVYVPPPEEEDAKK